ncbi:MAG: hypothetical protein HC794_02165 [Nitrospiraceae bacterium]|nr:hypothetical protein [Nitrospiraceae bacterium]
MAYGVGQVAESIKSNSFEFFLLFYYVQVLHLEPAKAGLALFLALVIDAITDPLLGSISDGARTRWADAIRISMHRQYRLPLACGSCSRRPPDCRTGRCSPGSLFSRSRPDSYDLFHRAVLCAWSGTY